MTEPPRFVTESELLSDAYSVAAAAHHGPQRRGDTDIDHPLDVAELLHEEGFEETVLAAALLHDVVEDTTVDLNPIEESFGSEVGALVSQMTEDAAIDGYRERKAEHRSRVAGDRRAAAIYAADKLAKVRRLGGSDELAPEKAEHYRRTLGLLRERYPDLPFLAELGDRLAQLQVTDPD